MTSNVRLFTENPNEDNPREYSDGDNEGEDRTVDAIDQQTQSRDAYIYSILIDIAYRRNDTDLVFDLFQLNAATATGSLSNRFIDGFVFGTNASNELNRITSIIDASESNVQSLLDASLADQGVTFTDAGRLRIDADPETGVYYIWNQAGFGAYIVYDQLEEQYIITFRGTDVSAQTDELQAFFGLDVRHGVENDSNNYSFTPDDSSVTVEQISELNDTVSAIINPLTGLPIPIVIPRPPNRNENDINRIGTDFQHQDEGDWFTNILLGDGTTRRENGTYIETQFDYALFLTEFVRDVLADGNINDVVVTGHSLGAGLASLAGVVTGAEIYAFGPAPFRASLEVLAERFGGDNSAALLQTYEEHLETHAYASTVEGEFVTFTAPFSPLQTAVRAQFGANDLFAPDRFLGIPINNPYEARFELGGDLTSFAIENVSFPADFVSSVGAYDIDVISDSNLIGLSSPELTSAFARESSARHSAALHTLLTTEDALAPDGVIGLDDLFSADVFLQFAFFHTPGLAGTLIQDKEGETESDDVFDANGNVIGEFDVVDPGQSLGTTGSLESGTIAPIFGVEPVYRLLTSSLLDQANTQVDIDAPTSFYQYFSEFFTLTTTEGSILRSGRTVTSPFFNTLSPTDKNLHSAVIKFALQIIRDAIGEGEDYADFQNQLNLNLGLGISNLTAAFAGDFESDGYITLAIDAITSDHRIFQERLFDFDGNDFYAAYGLSDLGKVIFDHLIDEGVSQDFIEERTEIDRTLVAENPLNQTSYINYIREGGVGDSIAVLVVQSNFNENISIDVSSEMGGGAVIFLDGSAHSTNYIEATNQDDFIFGSEGSDEINGNGGDDVITGGMGNDVITVGIGDSLVYGGEDNSTVVDSDVDVLVLSAAFLSSGDISHADYIDPATGQVVAESGIITSSANGPRYFH